MFGLTLKYQILFCLIALSLEASSGKASIYLENHTNQEFIFQVLHQYTDKGIESSPWKLIKPGESMHMFDVNYRYGFLTTGVDNWKVDGNDPSGQFWRAGYGLAADWKKHTLRSEDNNKKTYIKVYTDTLEFVSDSGVSETKWFRNNGRGNLEAWGHMFDVADKITKIVDISKFKKGNKK